MSTFCLLNQKFYLRNFSLFIFLTLLGSDCCILLYMDPRYVYNESMLANFHNYLFLIIQCFFIFTFNSVCWNLSFVRQLLLFSHYVMSTSFATPWLLPTSLFCPWFRRQEYWSGLPCPSPGYFQDTGIEAVSPALAGRFITTEVMNKGSPHLIDLFKIVWVLQLLYHYCGFIFVVLFLFPLILLFYDFSFDFHIFTLNLHAWKALNN